MAEVTILLSLKGQLAALQGVDPAAGGKEKKKKKGGGAGKEQAKVPPASSSVAPATIVNPAEVERLQGLVTEKVWIMLLFTFSFHGFCTLLTFYYYLLSFYILTKFWSPTKDIFEHSYTSTHLFFLFITLPFIIYLFVTIYYEKKVDGYQLHVLYYY